MKKIIFAACILFFTQMSLSAQVLKPEDADSKVAFVIKNMGLDVNGTLKGLKGTISLNPSDAGKSNFDVTVEVNTINTGIEKRDNHLKGPDFFDAAKYPQIRLLSKRILHKSGDTYYAEAVLTMHGVSRDIKFDFIAKPVTGGYNLTGGFQLIRQDYKIGGSSMTMGDKVNVVLSVTAKK